jgi:hypothetical protein
MKLRIKTVLKIVAAAGILLVEVGCSLSPLSTWIAAFSTAAVATEQNTANAYQLVEHAYYDSQIASLVVNFDADGFHPETIEPFMPAREMEARTRILDGLKQYAENLAEISGDQPLNDLDTQAAAFGESLQNLSKSDSLQSLSKSSNISSTDMNLAATAIDALGRALIERKRSKELPAILKEMKGSIAQVCQLLETDIGDPEKSGLQNQLKNNYATLIRKEEQYIHHNEDKMSPAEKRAEIERLPKLVADEKTADQALAATQSALEQLAKTHTALAESASAKDSPTFKVLLQELNSDGQHLNSFFQKLPAQ